MANPDKKDDFNSIPPLYRGLARHFYKAAQKDPKLAKIAAGDEATYTAELKKLSASAQKALSVHKVGNNGCAPAVVAGILVGSLLSPPSGALIFPVMLAFVAAGGTADIGGAVSALRSATKVKVLEEKRAANNPPPPAPAA